MRKPEGRGLLGRPKQRWEDNNKMRNKMGGCELASSGLEQEQLGGSCEHSIEIKSKPTNAHDY
jgi:hypothetical protein